MKAVVHVMNSDRTETELTLKEGEFALEKSTGDFPSVLFKGGVVRCTMEEELEIVLEPGETKSLGNSGFVFKFERIEA